jgi:hypothetical protein
MMTHDSVTLGLIITEMKLSHTFADIWILGRLTDFYKMD